MKGKCKELCIAERKLRNRRRKPKTPRKPLQPVEYVVVSESPRILRLKNGTRLKQAIEGVELYLSQGGRVYSLTKYGLRQIAIQYNRKKNYGQKSPNGVPNGPRYPYVMFGGKKYDVHLLVVLAWIGVRKDGEEIDHINGNIDDCRTVNLRIVTKEENRRCAQILRRLRKAARDLQDPSLDPKNMSQERLLYIFATLTVADPKDIMEEDFKHHREF